jgi:hypothetical protein
LVVHASVDGDARRARDKDRSNGEAAVETSSRIRCPPVQAVDFSSRSGLGNSAGKGLARCTPVARIDADTGRVASGAAASKEIKIQQQYQNERKMLLIGWRAAILMNMGSSQ